MAAKTIRVLVVDDSAVIREMIVDSIADSDGMELAASVASGKEALSRLDQLRPDVVTLDIQMPEMDGLQVLDEILKRVPMPVIMVSSLTQRAADVTLQALERGALDYVAKPGNISTGKGDWRDELIRKIRTSAPTNVRNVLQIRKDRQRRMAARRPETATASATASSSDGTFIDSCITIGISTGGPPALTSLLSSLKPPLPPILIVQHMPGAFTESFASRLNSISRLTVTEAKAGHVLRPNHVFVAPGGQHLHLLRQGDKVQVRIRGGALVSGHMPSADVLMQSAAGVFSARCLGVIMTGMGHDGVAGCAAIRAAGGFVLGQDEGSSDVYGMNKVAFTSGHVDRQWSLGELSRVIPRQCRKMFPLTNNKPDLVKSR
jgi:two-component system chemotaxis response regulator CheB